jgi:hypothetical protein
VNLYGGVAVVASDESGEESERKDSGQHC